MRQSRDEPILHRPMPPGEEPNLPKISVPRLAVILGVVFGLLGGGIGYSVARTTGEAQIIEKVVEKPGPERIVEKPGPERVVQVPVKTIECPTVQTVIQRIVTVEEPKPVPKPPAKPAAAPKPKPRTVIRYVTPYQWAQSPPRRECGLLDPFC